MFAGKWGERKFWMAVLAAIGIVLVDGLGLDLDWSSVTAFVTIVLGWIFGEAKLDLERMRITSREER